MCVQRSKLLVLMVALVSLLSSTTIDALDSVLRPFNPEVFPQNPEAYHNDPVQLPANGEELLKKAMSLQVGK